jgi:ubiquinone/menaquinone biosynthesis C-methylase UbiE
MSAENIFTTAIKPEPYRGNTAIVIREDYKKRYWFFNPDYAKIYESFYEGKYKEIDILEKEAIAVMLKHFPNAKRLLDVGCGTGHFTRWYAALGYETIGVDISPVMLDVAIALWDGQFYNAPAQRLPFPDGSFDVVSFMTCTEYMHDLRPVIREARRVGRQGIVIGIMNKWSLPTIRRKLQVMLGTNNFYSTATFRSPKQIWRICEEALGKEPFEFDWIGTAYPKFMRIRAARKPFASFVALAIRFKHELRSE